MANFDAEDRLREVRLAEFRKLVAAGRLAKLCKEKTEALALMPEMGRASRRAGRAQKQNKEGSD